jgi:hypothetical protein
VRFSSLISGEVVGSSLLGSATFSASAFAAVTTLPIPIDVNFSATSFEMTTGPSGIIL